MTLDRTTLETAVDLQQRSYRLLRYLAEPLDMGVIALGHDVQHGDVTFEQAAHDWLTRNHERMPRDCQPAAEDLRTFANVFASYLEASFDLDTGPAKIRVTAVNPRCWCPCCTYLAEAPHLRPKKLASVDKERARRLRAAYVRDAAKALGRVLDDAAIDVMAKDAALREPLSMAAYAVELVRRTRGEPTGPEVLALWRMFAWTEKGSPKRDFRLTADALLQAIAAVDDAIRARG